METTESTSTAALAAPRPTVDATLLHEVTDFLYDEAELLSNREFPVWLQLFTRDAIYWIPAGSPEQDPTRKVSLVYDNWQSLAERVWRFEGGLAYAQQPQSTTSHLVSNIRVLSVDRDGDAVGDVITVTSRFIVSEFREHVTYPYAGQANHRLVRTTDGLRILEKRVELINRGGHLGNLSLPL